MIKIMSLVLFCAVLFLQKNSSCDADGCCVFSRQDEAVSRVPNLSQLVYGTGKFYTRSRISMSQMCFKTAALIR